MINLTSEVNSMKIQEVCNFGVNFAVQMKKEVQNAFCAFAGIMGWVRV